jgi:hypothetical protein
MSYDPRAVNIGKQVKRIAATMLDQNRRRDFIRGFVKAEETIMRSRSRSNKGDKAD